MLSSTEAERPVSFQLFGADTKMMAKAADILNDFRPDIVDINMGCPVKKVTKKGAGAALMSTPQHAREIIKEVVANSVAPVTVKFRLGVNSDSIICEDFAKQAEDCGAAAVILHGRTWAQGFTGRANWNHVKNVKATVSIPVIGNGDITSHKQANFMIEQGYCDAVMIGRGALGNPWIFSPENFPLPSNPATPAALRHMDLMHQHIDTQRLLAVIKNHIGRYFKETKGSATIRKNIYACTSFGQLRTYLHDISAENGERG